MASVIYLTSFDNQCFNSNVLAYNTLCELSTTKGKSLLFRKSEDKILPYTTFGHSDPDVLNTQSVLLLFPTIWIHWLKKKKVAFLQVTQVQMKQLAAFKSKLDC